MEFSSSAIKSRKTPGPETGSRLIKIWKNGLNRSALRESATCSPFSSSTRASSYLPVSGPGVLRDLIAELEDSIDHSRDIGMGFLGPWLLSSLALISEDTEVRKMALQEAEKVLESECVGHNYLAFYPDAMEVALSENNWQGVEDNISTLIQYMSSEPLPLCEFYIERAQALMNHRINPGDGAARDALVKVGDDAKLSGLHHARRAIESALQSS